MFCVEFGPELFPGDRFAVVRMRFPDQPDIQEYRIWKKGFVMADLFTTTEASEYTLSSADIGKKLVVMVSAVDQDGLESGRTAPLEIRPPAPEK